MVVTRRLRREAAVPEPMLKTRVITALILVAALLPSLFFLPQRYWALLMAAVAGIAAWEWAGLLRWPSLRRIAYGAALALIAAGVTLANPALVEATAPQAALPTYWVAGLFWLLVVPLWLRFKWSALPGGALAGVVVILPAWLAMVQLRSLGPGVLLGILAAIWLADVAAYFSGKAFGKRKLAPSISPGKTWEGAVGAGIAVVVYGFVMRFLFGAGGGSALLWLGALVLLTAVSILGDLLESLVKRQAGMKDSSAILPGHGGVLDRIDSMTSTLPLVALLWLLLSSAEA